MTPSAVSLSIDNLANGLRSARPAVLFGLRLWAAVCLALYVAFWLELDNAYWAGTTAAIVSLPSLGASLRKAWFRMIGTVIGAVAIVALTACFPQQRMGFLLGLALWGAVCAFVATMLRNFAAYSAALAGYTAAIIASDELGAVGGANGEAFMLAVTRASEILHWHPLRRRRTRRNRFGRRAASAGSAARRHFRRNRARVCRRVVVDRAVASGDAFSSAGTRPACHRARPGHRRSSRRGV